MVRDVVQEGMAGSDRRHLVRLTCREHRQGNANRELHVGYGQMRQIEPADLAFNREIAAGRRNEGACRAIHHRNADDGLREPMRSRHEFAVRISHQQRHVVDIVVIEREPESGFRLRLGVGPVGDRAVGAVEQPSGRYGSRVQAAIAVSVDV